MAVRYHTDGCSYRLPQKRLTAAWLRRVAEQEGYTLAEVDYIFCSAERLLEMNRQYLGHDYFTDVITFDYSDRRGTRTVAGDIFIDVGDGGRQRPHLRRHDLAGDAPRGGARTAAPLRTARQDAAHRAADAPQGGQIPPILGDPAKVTPPTVRVPPRPTGRPSARPARDIRDSGTRKTDKI